MKNDTRDDSGRGTVATIPPLDGRLGRRLVENVRRPADPTPFSQTMLRARLALLRPRPVRLVRAADEK